MLWPSTIAKAEAREALRQLITAELPGMTSAQIRNAKGIGHLMLRDPSTGKFERVVSTGNDEKDKAIIDAAIAQGREQCWIYLKDPSIQAYTDLTNRAVDKPSEPVQEVEHKGTITIRWKK